jgi:hypothetical protein
MKSDSVTTFLKVKISLLPRDSFKASNALACKKSPERIAIGSPHFT